MLCKNIQPNAMASDAGFPLLYAYHLLLHDHHVQNGGAHHHHCDLGRAVTLLELPSIAS